MQIVFIVNKGRIIMLYSTSYKLSSLESIISNYNKNTYKLTLAFKNNVACFFSRQFITTFFTLESELALDTFLNDKETEKHLYDYYYMQLQILCWGHGRSNVIPHVHVLK